MAQLAKNLGDYYTIQGASEKLGTTFWAIYGYIKRNGIPTIKVGRTIMVRLQDLNGMEVKR